MKTTIPMESMVIECSANNSVSRSNFVEGQEHSDDEGVRAGYNSGTDDERSNEAFANLRARSTSPLHTTTMLNDVEHGIDGDNKRARSTMSDTDTSGDEDQFMEDEVQEVFRRELFVVLDGLLSLQMQIPIRSATQSQINVEPSQDSLLDLGDDRMDYRPPAISKHHQRCEFLRNMCVRQSSVFFLFRRKYVTGANSISTRPYLR